MPSTIFISSLDPRKDKNEDDCYVNVDIVEKEILRRWPLATVMRGYGIHLLRWHWQKTGREGRLHSGPCTVSFESFPLEETLDFAIWFRTIVPDTYPLYVFNDGLHTIFELKSGATLNEIKNAFSVS